MIGLNALAVCVLLAAFAALGLSWRKQRKFKGMVQRRLDHYVASALKGVETPIDEAPLASSWLEQQCFRAQMTQRGLTLILIGLALGLTVAHTVGLGLAEALVTAPVLVALVAALVRLRIARRLNQLHDALPIFLDRLRQQILIGASVPQALQRVVGVSPDIIRWVFEPVERRVNAAGELVETLEWAARRHRGEGLAGLVAAISASLRYGGRLSEALANLSQMERQRLQVRQEMHGATSEVRASSVVLAILPLGVGIVFFLMTPGFAPYFFDPERGRPVLYFVIGLYLVGLLLLRQIAQPKF
ncbi:MAG: type secretion system protein [Rubritepida sp.]|nr:type secretion system protein [Rubritepida sp.]